MAAAEIERLARRRAARQRRQPRRRSRPADADRRPDEPPAGHRPRAPAAAGRSCSTRTARQVAIGQREWTHAALPGVPGSQVFDTARNWRADLRVHPRGARTGRAAAGRDRGGEQHEHARGDGPVRRRRARDLGLPERRLAGRRRGRRARRGAATRGGSSRPGGDWVSITSPARFLLDPRPRARDVRARSPTSGCSATGSSTG